MFAHLHTHSYYSFLDAVPAPSQLAAAAAAHQMPALALTDHHGLTGAIDFYVACRNAGVRPVLGVELVVNHALGRGPLVFLAQDRIGWANLCRLSSLLQTEPHRDPQRGLSFEAVLDSADGLICLTGGRTGILNQLIETAQPKQVVNFLAELQACFPGRLYVELQRLRPADHSKVLLLTELADAARLPVVATNNVHFLEARERPLHRLLSAIRTNIPYRAIPDDRLVPEGAYFASAQEMAARFSDQPQAIAASLEIAERCNLVLPLDVPHYPELPLPSGKTAVDVLQELARKGAVQAYNGLTPEIETRLAHELAIIEARGYAPLFLIMSEILSYARREGVPTASRGSASSSLVAHCLGITTPDPLEHNLYFERFLNPARKSPPDIDTDLCSVRRDKVLRHVYEQYGDERVAMVATINRLRGRSALREVAKAHGMPPGEIKTLVDGLPYRSWGPRRGDADEPYEDLSGQFPQYRHILKDAAALLEFPRHLSVHPGGIVIAPGRLTDLVPLHLAGKGLVITQFDLEAVQRMGLVKIDLLGTRGLSVLGDVAEKVQLWNRREYVTPLDVLDAISQDDAKTAALVEATQTIGCFQIESPGMRATLREVQARSPQDILVALALYRPGPMTGGLKDAFVRRHLGQEKVRHLHPALSTLLADTHGVILYQEQVLRVASELAGLSLADADLLRRAMSHFDPGEQMRTLKARFITGAEEKRGVPPAIGEQIWELMAAFAGYGFPKAHAASYAQVAWQSAWCKAHYPAEFIAAVLANWGGYYRQRVYLNEARRLGLKVRPPHINHAGSEFRVTYPKGEPVLYMGLNQVRDLTRRTQERIMAARPFRSLEDFLARVDPRPQEAANLARVGGLDGLGEAPDLIARIGGGGWKHAQPYLFELPGAPAGEPDWTISDRLDAQQAILGTPVDVHPLELLPDAVLRRVDTVPVFDAALRVGETLQVLGMRQTLQRFFHAGETRYIMELEDLSGVIPVVFTREQQGRFRSAIDSRKPLLISGRVEMDMVRQEAVLVARRVEMVNL